MLNAEKLRDKKSYEMKNSTTHGKVVGRDDEYDIFVLLGLKMVVYTSNFSFG